MHAGCASSTGQGGSCIQSTPWTTHCCCFQGQLQSSPFNAPSALSCPVLPRPSLPCPALPCPALPYLPRLQSQSSYAELWLDYPSPNQEQWVQEQGSLASSGIASPAKSEASDDLGFGQTPDSQVMQQQMDWLLLKLITFSRPTSPETAPEPASEADEDRMVSPRDVQAPAKPSSKADDPAVRDSTNEAGKQVASLQGELKSVQAQLQASEEVAAEAAGVQQELLQLHSRLTASGQQEAESQQLVSQLQTDLQTAQQLAGSLQQQLDRAKAEASSQGPAHHSRSSSRSEMELSVSRTQLQQQEVEQPVRSMTIAEADLVEAASNAIQAQASCNLCMFPSQHLRCSASSAEA